MFGSFSFFINAKFLIFTHQHNDILLSYNRLDLNWPEKAAIIQKEFAETKLDTVVKFQLIFIFMIFYICFS